MENNILQIFVIANLGLNFSFVFVNFGSQLFCNPFCFVELLAPFKGIQPYLVLLPELQRYEDAVRCIAVRAGLRKKRTQSLIVKSYFTEN